MYRKVTGLSKLKWFNTLRPRQNGRHFPDGIFKCIFLNENVWSSIGISLKFLSRVPIDNKPALVQIMAWRRPGDKPLSEPMMTSLNESTLSPAWESMWDENIYPFPNFPWCITRSQCIKVCVITTYMPYIGLFCDHYRQFKSLEIPPDILIAVLCPFRLLRDCKATKYLQTPYQ